MFTLLKRLHQAFTSRVTAYFRKREIVRVLRATHMVELAQTPVHQHPQLIAQQRHEIEGIRAGKLPLVNRRTLANTGLPITFTRINAPVAKQTPLSMRRFSRTPVPSRAINLVKAGLLGLNWEIRAIEGKANPDNPDVKARINIATDCMNKPNDDDSFRTWIEQVLNDYLIFGMGCTETQANPFDNRPVKMWAVDGNTIQIVGQWKESEKDILPRYVQQLPYTTATNQGVMLFDDELMCIRDNIATDSPFGFGCLEIAYKCIADLLGAQRQAGNAASDQLGRSIFWWSGAVAPQAMTDLRDYIQGELEGAARLGMIGGAPKPDLIETNPTQPNDLLLPWHEMLIRMIGNSFNLSGMALGIERDVNRNTGEVLDDKDFRSAVVPVAKRFQEAITRRIIHVKMGWDDLELVFKGTEDPDMETKLAIQQARYQANAMTGNDMNVEMGYKKIDSPFADITSIECQFLMAYIAKLPAQVNPNAPPMLPGGPGQPPMGQPPMGQPAPGGGGFKPKPPVGVKQLSLPKPGPLKLPMSANELLGMNKTYLRALQYASVLPKSSIVLADAMEADQPGVLKELSDEVWDYFEELAEREIDKSKSRKATLSKKWTDLAKKRYGRDAKRYKNLHEHGGFFGLPLSSAAASSPVKAPRKVGNRQQIGGRQKKVKTGLRY